MKEKEKKSKSGRIAREFKTRTVECREIVFFFHRSDTSGKVTVLMKDV